MSLSPAERALIRKLAKRLGTGALEAVTAEIEATTLADETADERKGKGRPQQVYFLDASHWRVWIAVESLRRHHAMSAAAACCHLADLDGMAAPGATLSTSAASLKKLYYRFERFLDKDPEQRECLDRHWPDIYQESFDPVKRRPKLPLRGYPKVGN